MLDQLDEWGYALDDFLADHPDIDLSFRQSPADPAELTAELTTLPADYVAQPGWIAIDAWPENDASPPLTIDQIKRLRTDNVADGSLPGLEALGVDPTPIETVLPSYLVRFRNGGQYAEV